MISADSMAHEESGEGHTIARDHEQPSLAVETVRWASFAKAHLGRTATTTELPVTAYSYTKELEDL